MTTNIDLKKYCIETALGSPDPVKVARQIYEFLTETPAPITTSPTQAPVTQLKTRVWSAPALTKTQKAALAACLNLRMKGELINGVAVSRALKCTQSNASAHLSTLVKKKYLRRQGNKWFAALGLDGRELDPIIEKCPPGVAKGFKPMTVKLGDLR